MTRTEKDILIFQILRELLTNLPQNHRVEVLGSTLTSVIQDLSEEENNSPVSE